MPVQAPAPPFINSVVEAFKTRLRGIYNAPSATPPLTSKPWEPPPSTIPKQAPSLPTVKINPLPQQALPPRGNVNSLGVPIKRFAPEPPPTTNPVPRIAPPPGSGGAAVVTTTAGGLVSGAGLLTGGLSLFAGGLLVYNASQLYKLFKLSQPESKPIPPSEPTIGQPGIRYRVVMPLLREGKQQFYGDGSLVTVTCICYGPIYRPINGRNAIEYGANPYALGVIASGTADPETLPYIGKPTFTSAIGYAGPTTDSVETIISITRLDDQQDINPNPAPGKIPTRSPSPLALKSPVAVPTPRPTSNPFGQPPPAPVGMPLATNNRIPYTITTPGSNPITITSPGAAPITISPASSPATIKITRPSASPFLSPTPASTPRAIPVTTPTGTPKTTPAGVPIAVSSPGSVPTNLVMPRTNPITINYPGQEPIVIDPVGTKPPSGVQAAPIPKPGAFITTPSSPTQTPTKPKTPTTPTTPNNPFADIKDPDLAKIGLGLVGITQLLQGLNTNTTPAAIQNAVTPAIAPAVCSTTKPGGCSSNMTNNAVSKGNEDLKQYLTKQLPNILGDSANAAIGADTNARVRKIEGDTAKIRESTGSDRYPMVLPEYLLDDFLDKSVTIPDQVAYNVWLLKQIDALVGLFPIKIERIDENGVKQLLKFENIAEAIAELTGLLAQIAFDSDTAVNVATRATGEAVGAKAAALQAGSYLKAIVDYMGFQGQAVSIDVPISVTPGAVGLDGKLQESELKDFLKPSIQKTIGFKNTDPVDQRLVMRRILESGEISRAALFKPLKADQSQNPLTGDAIKADKKAEEKRINDLWEAFKLRMEGHTAGTKVDIDDGVKPEDITP